MEHPREKTKEFHFFAILWGIPGLLTLLEAYRLAGLPKLREVNLAEGPVGYMMVIGSLLIGFSVWEIVTGLRQEPIRASSESNAGIPLSRKIWFTIIYMILFLILVPILGFVMASGFFLTVTLLLLGCKAKAIFITVLCYCGGLYWMIPLLGLSLPRGFLGI